MVTTQDSWDAFEHFWGDARALVIEHQVDDATTTTIMGGAAKNFTV